MPRYHRNTFRAKLKFSKHFTTISFLCNKMLLSSIFLFLVFLYGSSLLLDSVPDPGNIRTPDHKGIIWENGASKMCKSTIRVEWEELLKPKSTVQTRTWQHPLQFLLFHGQDICILPPHRHWTPTTSCHPHSSITVRTKWRLWVRTSLSSLFFLTIFYPIFRASFSNTQ